MALGLENWPFGYSTGQGYGNAGQWNDLQGTTKLYFVVEKEGSTAGTDTTAPLLSSISPTQSATGVGVSSNFVLTFNETVKAGTGSFIVKSGTNTIATVSATDTSQVTFNGSTVTINPASDLAYGTSYTVTAAAGVIKDSAGNSWSGTATTPFSFTTATATDSTAPKILNYSNSIVATGNWNCKFSESVTVTESKIKLYQVDKDYNKIGDNLFFTISYTGQELTINPLLDLNNGSNYQVDFLEASIKDYSGNDFNF